MKFTVKQIAILQAKTGEGLRVDDKVIGCAKITSIDTENGASLEEFAKEGICLGYELTDDKTSLTLNKEDIAKGVNYVMFIREPGEEGKPGPISTVLNTLDITKAFGLPDADAEMMEKYLGALANQRGLQLVHYTDMESGTNSMMFVNQFDRELNDMVLAGDTKEATNTYQSMLANPEYRTELQTDNFIRLFVMAVVQAGQDRYNKLHRTDVIEKVAKLIAGIKYWEDGVLHTPSVKDVNDFVEEIKEYIEVK